MGARLLATQEYDVKLASVSHGPLAYYLISNAVFSKTASNFDIIQNRGCELRLVNGYNGMNSELGGSRLLVSLALNWKERRIRLNSVIFGLKQLKSWDRHEGRAMGPWLPPKRPIGGRGRNWVLPPPQSFRREVPTRDFCAAEGASEKILRSIGNFAPPTF